MVIGGQRRVQRHDVGLRQQLVEAHVRRVGGHALVDTHVVGQHLAAEALEMADHRAADAASAHDAHGAVAQRATHLAAQRVVLHASAIRDLRHAAQAHHGKHDGVVSDGLGRVRGMRDANAQVTAGIEVDVIHADVARGNGVDAQVKPSLNERAIDGRRHDAHDVVARSKGGVVKRRVVGRPAELDVPLAADLLKKAQLIKRAHSVGKQADTCLGGGASRGDTHT